MLLENRYIYFGLLGLIAILIQSCGGGGSSVGSSPVNSDGTFPLTFQPTGINGYFDPNNPEVAIIVPHQLTALGGSPQPGYTWSITLGTTSPIQGMLVNSQTGVVSGTGLPTANGVGFQCGIGPETCGYEYTVKVTVSDGTRTASEDVNVDIWLNQNMVDPTFIVNGQEAGFYGSPTEFDINKDYFGNALITGAAATTNIPAGIPFGFSLTAQGGVAPYQWVISSGSLPPGLYLDPARGVIYGTPNPDDVGNTYLFSVSAQDSVGDVSPDISAGYITVTDSITISNGVY
jgi:large repetitive protein